MDNPKLETSNPKPIIVDGHLDIAWNKVALQRDFLESVAHKRAREGDKPAHGEGIALVGLPEMLTGNVRLAFATIYVAPARPNRQTWGRTYNTPEEAHAQAFEQVAYYRELPERDERVALVTTRAELERVLATPNQVGLVLLMEGADPIIEPAQVSEWAERGVRIVGPAWRQTRYAGGTGAPGPLTKLGRALMPQLEHAGMILDVSHLAEESFWEALDLFGGIVIASHSNCRALVDSDRHLSDAMIRALVARDGMIGIVLYGRFLKAGWETSARRETLTLNDVVRHIEHVCDLAGDVRHVGIGSDFDGGFGMEAVPREIETIADLHRLGDALSDADFSDADIASILGENWIRLLHRALPA